MHDSVGIHHVKGLIRKGELLGICNSQIGCQSCSPTTACRSVDRLRGKIDASGNCAGSEPAGVVCTHTDSDFEHSEALGRRKICKILDVWLELIAFQRVGIEVFSSTEIACTARLGIPKFCDGSFRSRSSSGRHANENNYSASLDRVQTCALPSATFPWKPWLRWQRVKTIISSARARLDKPGRISSLDGLRAISISCVVVWHLAKWKHIDLGVPQYVGGLGVQIFFVISGYLITKLLLDEHERSSTVSLKNFYLRRAFRIFPAAFAFLLLVSCLFWKDIGWGHLGAAVFYVANMDETRPWIFGHLWSLSIEEQFYLLWPWAVKKWFRHRVAILITVSIATPVFRTILLACKAHGGILGSLLVCSDQLAIGCLLAVFASRLPRISRWAALSMLAVVVFVPLYPAVTPIRTLLKLFLLEPVLNGAIAGLVLHVIQHPYRVLNWGPVCWLGRISYSLYLWQQLFCSNASLHFGFSLVVPALICASISYYVVEQPLLRLREVVTSRTGRKTAALSVQASVAPDPGIPSILPAESRKLEPAV